MPQTARMHVFRVSPLIDGRDALAAVETLRFGGFDGTASYLARLLLLLLLLPLLCARVVIEVLFWRGLSV